MIGFEFESISDTAWLKAYEYAAEYYNIHGNIDLPAVYKIDNGFDLGYWICRQRKNKKSLSKKQIEMLDSIGMIWSAPAERQWEQGFKHLVQYKNRYGTATPSAAYRADDGYTLGRWFSRQKKSFINGELNKEQIEKLTGIGAELN